MDHKPNLDELKHALPQFSNLELLGEGGFKAVYKAQIQSAFEALKVVFIPPDSEGDGAHEEIVARVRREIDALRRCRTKLLVSLGSLEMQRLSISGKDYLVYSEELLPGESLRALIRSRSSATYQELCSLTLCLMEALKAIESIGHIHRDIKPDNIMATGLAARPFVVLDLGIAFKVHGTELTARGSGPPGTLVYMAPELFQTQYKDVLDIRSDIYSAGVTIFEYAAGEHPFVRRGDNQYTTLYRILNQPAEKLETKRRDLPSNFCRFVDRCFKKLPALRFSNPGSALRELEGMI